MITEENSVQFLRLNTGEDLISEVTEIESEDNRYYLLHNPMKIVYQVNPGQGLVISLMQWVFFKLCDNQDFVIYPNDIITMNKTTEDMESHYWESIEHFNDNKKIIERKTKIDSSGDAVQDPIDLLADIQNYLKGKDKRNLH